MGIYQYTLMADADTTIAANMTFAVENWARVHNGTNLVNGDHHQSNTLLLEVVE